MKSKLNIILFLICLGLAGAALFFLLSSPVTKQEQKEDSVPTTQEEKTYVPTASIEEEIKTSEENVSSTEFSVEDYYTKNLFPANATEKVEKNVNFQGDDFPEKVIFYRSKDNIGEGKIRTNQHIQVFAFESNEWKMVKNDLVPNDNVAVEARVIRTDVIDLGEDKKEELFVVKCSGRRCNTTYYVFGLVNGEYKDLEIPKGYLHEKEYMNSDDLFIHLVSLKADEKGIKEGYDVYCEAKKNFGEVEFGTDGAVCRHFEIFIHYENGSFRVEKLTEKT